MFGFEQHLTGGSYCFVASGEKALFEGYYLDYFTAEDFEEYGNRHKLRQYLNQLERFKDIGRSKLMEVLK